MLDEELEQQTGGADGGLVVVIGVEAADAGDTGHHYIIAVAVHFMQGYGCADGALEAAAAAAGPFIDPVRNVFLLDARDHLLVLVHGLGGVLHSVRSQADGLEEVELAGDPAVGGIVEVCTGVGVDVLGHVVDVLQGALKELSCPVEIAEERDRELGLVRLAVVAVLAALLGDGGSGGDELDARVLLEHLLAEVVVLQDIVSRGHVAELPLAVAFIADAPVDHSVRSRVSVLRALAAHRGALGAVHILHPLSCRISVTESGVDDQIRLTAQQPAPCQVLVGTHVVGLDGVPGVVVAGRTLVRVADAVTPLVTGEEVSSRPAVDRRSDILQDGENVGAIAFDIVRRHQRDGSDREAAAAFAHDLKGGVLYIRTCREVEVIFLVIFSQAVEDHRLAVGGATAPNEADGDFRGAVGLEDDTAHIAAAVLKPQASLADAVLAGGQADDGRLLAHVWIGLVHGDR